MTKKNILIVLCVLFSITLSAQELPVYTGPMEVRKDLAHDGQLRWVVGASSYEVVRSVPSNPSATDGSPASYRHQHNIAYWGDQFWVFHQATLYTDEDSKRGRLNWSDDGRTWLNANSAEIFPHTTHQRVAFYIARNNVFLVNTWYSQNGEDGGMDASYEKGKGRGYVGTRLVRQILGPNKFGPIYALRHNHKGAATFSGSQPAHYNTSSDEAFKTACTELLNNKLYRQQFQEEDRDSAFYVVNNIPFDKEDWELCRAFTWYTLDNGKIIGLWKHAYTTADTWDFGKVTNLTGYSDALKLYGSSKLWGCKTADGRFAMIGNPAGHPRTGRWPLIVSTSSDGITFDTPWATLEGDMGPARYPSTVFDGKDAGHQYVRGIEEGFPMPPGDDLCLVTSHNKEDIWVTRIPVPIITQVTGDVKDDFQNVPAGGPVPLWNLRSAQWAPVKVFDDGDNHVLRLSDKDGVDYAKAFRVFETTTSVDISFRMRPRQAKHGRLEIDVMDQKGQRPLRLTLDDDGSVMANDGEIMKKVGCYTENKWVAFEIKVDVTAGTYSLKLNGKPVVTNSSLAIKVDSVERLEFRTGLYRLQDFARRPTQRPYATNFLANADLMVNEAVFDVDDVLIPSKKKQ
jgi:hypothetical protein